jgi:hypothetical protein
MTHLRLTLVVAFVSGFALIGAAHAFTFEGGSPGTAGSGQNYLDTGTKAGTDPDDKVNSRFGTDGGSTMKFGNSTVQFGAQPSFQQRYDSSQMFKQYDLGGDR